jgi:hypothetical protein
LQEAWFFGAGEETVFWTLTPERTSRDREPVR